MKHYVHHPPSERHLTVLLFLLIAGCVEPDIYPRGSGPPSPDTESLPYGEHPADDDLGEDPHMIALAQQHPSFAGMFFEPGTDRLVVASTSTDPKDAAALRRTVLTAVSNDFGHPTAADGELAMAAVHRVFEYSFLELARHRARIRSQVFGIPGVEELSVDEQHNRIKIGLSDRSARVKVERLAADLAIPIQMLSLAQASPAEPLVGTSRSTLPRPAMSSEPTLRDVISVPDDRLRGGYMIQAVGVRDDALCTLGFTAAVKFSRPKSHTHATFFVTNSHCSKFRFFLDSGLWNQPDNRRGPERKDPGHDYFPRGVGRETIDLRPHGCRTKYDDRCRHADASLVQTHFIPDFILPGDTVHPIPRLIALGEIGRTKERSNCSICEASTTIDTVNSVIRIVGTRDMIVDGEELDKVGQRTGWTYGNVQDTCVNYPSGWGVSIRCTGKIRFAVGGGDSGSPVFQYYENSDSANLVGIVWGAEGRDATGLARVGLISNFGRIKTDLGEFLLVCNYMGPCDKPL